MKRVYLDVETYCDLDLRKVGVYRYVEHESFQMLMCAYAVDDGPVRVAVGAVEIFEQVEPLLADPDALFVAHNSAFDRVAFSAHLGMPVGDYLPPDRWEDSMVLAAMESYPQSLDKAAKALKVKQKDTAGTLLINKFCKPNRTGGRNDATTHPEDWARFVEYCGNDVEAMRAAVRKLPEQPAAERAVWIADQLINDRGIRIDVPMAEAAVAAAAENKAAARDEMITLTGVENPASVQQLTAWLEEQGVVLPDLRADTVKQELSTPSQLQAAPNLGADVRRVLELRQELALSASAKFEAAVNMTCSDGRLRGSAKYYGAHTGRWAGRGVQLQNLPRVSLRAAEQMAVLDLKAGFGAPPETLKALVRPLILGPLTVVDYSAIEARVLAWLGGETWALDAFRAGRDIYVETADRMGGLTRQEGKVATLALGFAGGVGALRRMGGEALGDDAYLKDLVDRWREANPNIKSFWYELWNAFRSTTGGTAGPITVRASKGVRRVVLPSGREIVYRGFCRPTDPDTGKQYYSFSHPTGKKPRLWAGTIVENVVQATARDLLAGVLPKLEALGLPTVGHVHDEILIEGEHLDKLTALMVDNPPWAAGLPLNAEGHIVDRYTK